MPIAALIDKQDNFEIVRDQIAAILVVEVASQMTLAAAAGKNPDDWKLRIFSERSNPWEQFLNQNDDPSPIVNIAYDNANYIQAKSNIHERQAAEATFNIDCFAIGLSRDDPDAAGGHIAGDQEATLKAQQTLRLIRNIVMSADYAYLALQGLVKQRWIQSTTVFQPSENNQIQKITGARLVLNVTYNEFSPQVPTQPLELLTVDVIKTDTGQIMLEADYDYTL